jgi:hypothetical protein
MDKFLGLPGIAWTGIYTIITFGLLVVTAVAALYAMKQWQIAREQAADARQAQMEASRPYVIVTIEPSGADWHLFDLVVKNIGARPALGVSIALDPPPMRASEMAGHEIANAKMLNEPVAMIAPGQEMRTFYDSHVERNGREDLASYHLVCLAYQDSSQHDYMETSVLDIDAMKGTTYTSVQTIHDIGQTLEKMQKTFDSASLLQRSGTVAVAASIESHAKHQQRLAEERSEWEERRDRIMK